MSTFTTDFHPCSLSAPPAAQFLSPISAQPRFASGTSAVESHHDTAHAIGWLHRAPDGKPLSHSGGRLLDRMDEDLEELWTSASRLVRRRPGETEKEHQGRVLQLIADDVHRLPHHAWIVDDFFQGAWGEAYPERFGHGVAYWNNARNHRRMSEAFAEMMETQLCNPEAWAAITQRFPRTAAAFDDLIQEALNERRQG